MLNQSRSEFETKMAREANHAIDYLTRELSLHLRVLELSIAEFTKLCDNQSRDLLWRLIKARCDTYLECEEREGCPSIFATDLYDWLYGSDRKVKIEDAMAAIAEPFVRNFNVLAGAMEESARSAVEVMTGCNARDARTFEVSSDEGLPSQVIPAVSTDMALHKATLKILESQEFANRNQEFPRAYVAKKKTLWVSGEWVNGKHAPFVRNFSVMADAMAESARAVGEAIKQTPAAPARATSLYTPSTQMHHSTSAQLNDPPYCSSCGQKMLLRADVPNNVGTDWWCNHEART